MPDFDLVIRNGTVATASDDFAVFGGIVGDQVVAFGEELGAASREIDAAGELLCQCGVSGLFSSGKLRDLPPYALALKWSRVPGAPTGGSISRNIQCGSRFRVRHQYRSAGLSLTGGLRASRLALGLDKRHIVDDEETSPPRPALNVSCIAEVPKGAIPEGWQFTAQSRSV